MITSATLANRKNGEQNVQSVDCIEHGVVASTDFVVAAGSWTCPIFPRM